MVKTIGKISYDEYIKSYEWSDRKDTYFLTHKKICAGCGSAELIDLHHMDYDRLGNENDIDLIPLCDVCHDQYHEIYEKPLVISSKAFVTAKQASVKGKEIFFRYQELVTRIINKAVEQFSEGLSQAKSDLKGVRYNRLPSWEKDGFKLQALKTRNFIDHAPWLALAEIIKMENPYEVALDEHDLVNHVNLNIEEIGKRLEYLWVMEEIKAIMPQNPKTTEIDKLKKILQYEK